MLLQGFDPTLQQQERDVSPSLTGPSILFSSAQTPICTITQVFCTAAPLSIIPTSLFGAIAPPLASSLNAELATKPMSLYRLLRDVQTTPDLWKKWTIGLGSLPSIDELDRIYGSRWRTDNEIQYYSTRNRIVNKIKRRAGSSITTDNYKAVIRGMEEKRAHSKASLDKVTKALQAAKI